MTVMEKGKAGRTNYSDWDRKASELLQATKQEEDEEKEQAKNALGLDGKYARSQAEAEEREKLKAAEQAKKKLDQFQSLDQQRVQSLSGILGSVGRPELHKKAPTIITLTREQLDPNKRVVVICDTQGDSESDQIVLSRDLNHITSDLPVNSFAKSFPDDAENKVEDEEKKESQRVYGIIKVHLENVHRCTVSIESKLIAGTVELHKCSDVTVRFEPSATATTIQADLSQRISVEWYDAEKDFKIFHAGVSDMRVRLHTRIGARFETTADYLRDGAKQMGNSTAEEYRFVTHLVDGKLLTEPIVEAGTKPLTAREVEMEKERRKKAEDKILETAESMIQIKDKDGNPIVKKVEVPEIDSTPGEEEVVEEVLTDSLKRIVDQCNNLKSKGNEAFGMGEYVQAVLQYSLALDEATKLQSDNKRLFPCDVVYSNRSACFLKMGEHEKAEQDASKALKINPDNIKAKFRRGLALHALKRYAEALPILAEAHKIEPSNKQIKQALQFCEVRLEQEYRKRMMGHED